MKLVNLLDVLAGNDGAQPTASFLDPPDVETVARTIRDGRAPLDLEFDRFLPAELRRVSRVHWTSVAVAMRVGAWLDHYGVRSVVDVGAGAGKFCVVGALASRASFVGIERRSRLVEGARALASTFGVDDRVRFLDGDFTAARVPLADAYFFYNPFGENLFGAIDRIDESVDLGVDRFERDVAEAESLLANVPVGTLLVTYNGFGGRVPPDFEQVECDRSFASLVRLYRKASAEPSGTWPFDRARSEA